MQALYEHIAKDGFRLRGSAMSRIDGFSDVVFGFALTLLVVSLEIPHTFEELNHSLHGFIPFSICFLFLILIWYSHFKFFRRYGLHDAATVALNAGLLFVVLFYVYPLKFLFTILTAGWLGGDAAAFGTAAQMRELMMLYGLGFMAVYWLFAALYWNAWRQRLHLKLNSIEEFLTRSSIIEYTSMGGMGLLSVCVAFALPRGYAGMAGFVYMLLWLVGMVHGYWERHRLRDLHAGHR